jgi:hypothetical protein
MTLAFKGIMFVGILRSSSAGVTDAFTLPGLLEGNHFALELVGLLIAPALFSDVARHKSQTDWEYRKIKWLSLQRTGVLADELEG